MHARTRVRTALVVLGVLVAGLLVGCAGPTEVVTTATHVIYTSKEGSATFQVWRMKPDGTGREKLTDDPRFEHHWPRPSPDGTRILFYRAEPGQTVNDIGTNSLWSMAADGSDQRLIIPRGANGWTRQAHAEWSPDGRRIVMAAGEGELELWTTDEWGRDPRLLTDRRNPLGAKVTTLDPSWAPDGRHVVFTGCPRDTTVCFWWDYEVFRLDLLTGIETRLTYDAVPDFDPYVSPDGRTLVWLRCTGSFPAGPWGLYRGDLHSPGAEPTPVVDDGHVNSNATFSPDGSTLLFPRHEFGGPPIMTLSKIRVDGSGLTPIGNRDGYADEGGGAYLPGR